MPTLSQKEALNQAYAQIKAMSPEEIKARLNFRGNGELARSLKETSDALRAAFPDYPDDDDDDDE